VTCGDDGGWVSERGDRDATHFDAYPVTPVDTTGCGDAFHGVYVATLFLGMPLPDRIRYAAAAAAINATCAGAQRGIPTRAGIESFLAKQTGWVG
jgi:ribokinase